MLPVTVVACVAPRQVQEYALMVPVGTTVGGALQACGFRLPEASAERAGQGMDVGVWGRATRLDGLVQPGDRVEVYRPLTVDPKVARRERFARQGARTTGLFARQRPGGKSGY